MKNNKAISLFLCVSLITSPLLLEADNVFSNVAKNGFTEKGTGKLNEAIGFANVTKSTTIEGPDGASYYGGGVEFRFNNEMDSFEPWADFEAPSVSAGCNGFSINGGFASFMDLGKIGDQLANAGGALAWGLLVGLVNSVPTLEHVFSKIKGWIQWMQDLVRNACNIGSNISGNLMASSGWTSKAQNWLDHPVDVADTAVGGVMKRTTDFLSGLGTISPTGNKREDISKDYGAGVYGAIYIIRGKVGDFLYSQFIKTKSQFPKDDADRKKLREFTEETIKGSNSNELQYLLFVNLFGEEVVSDSFIKFLDEKGSIISDLIAKGKVDLEDDSGSKDNKKASKKTALDNEAAKTEDAFRGSSSGDPTRMERILEVKFLPSPNVNASFIKTVLRGNKDKKLSLYPMQIIHSQVMDKGGIVHSLLAAKSFDSNEVEISWEGLVEESKKLIKCTLKKQTCQKNVLGLTLVAPNADETLETLAYVNAEEKSKNKIKGDFGPLTSQLIDSFAKQNANFFAIFMLQNLVDAWSKKAAGNQDTEGTKTQKEIEKTLNAYIVEVQKGIEDGAAITKEYTKYFDEIKQKLQKERIQK